jgi:hypothetical protein
MYCRLVLMYSIAWSDGRRIFVERRPGTDAGVGRVCR